MAVDQPAERAALIGLGNTGNGWLQLVDADVDATDRAIALGLYTRVSDPVSDVVIAGMNFSTSHPLTMDLSASSEE